MDVLRVSDSAVPRRRGVLAALLAAGLALTALIAAPTAALAAPEDCVGGVISADNITVTVTNTSSGATSGPTSPWEMFRFDVDLTGLDGMTAGCQAVIGIPTDLFEGMQNGSLSLYADGTSGPDIVPGQTVAQLVIDGPAQTMTFTLTDYASTHTSVAVNGWATAQINASFLRGDPIPVRRSSTAVAPCPASRRPVRRRRRRSRAGRANGAPTAATAPAR